MRTTWLVSLLLPSFAAAAGPVCGQQAAPVDSGARLRIRAPAIAHARLTGTLVSWRQDTIVLRSDLDRALVTVPTATITEIQRSTGRRSNVVRGAAIGTLAGASTGALVALATGQPGNQETRAFIAAFGAVVGGAFGLVAGTIAGALSPGDRWELIPSRGVGLRVTIPPGGRPGLGLAVTF